MTDPTEKLYDGLTREQWEIIAATNPDNDEYWKRVAQIWAEEYYADLMKKWDDEALEDGS